jgi:plasmid stabilization system protein ParE
LKVLWTEAALGHAAAIRDYISQTSPFYAERMMLRLLSRTEQLESFPESGPRVPEAERPDVRELLEGPYRIIYRIAEQHLEVLAIVHGARARVWPLPER